MSAQAKVRMATGRGEIGDELLGFSVLRCPHCGLRLHYEDQPHMTLCTKEPTVSAAPCKHSYGAWEEDVAGVVRRCARCDAIDARPEG
jgi:hypothetical protein